MSRGFGGCSKPLEVGRRAFPPVATDGLPGTLSGPRGSGLLLDLSREILLVPLLLLFARFKFVFEVTGTEKQKREKTNSHSRGLRGTLGTLGVHRPQHLGGGFWGPS